MSEPAQTLKLETVTAVTVYVSPFYCMACGEKGIWAEGVPGDHTGRYACAKCGECYYMNNNLEPDQQLDVAEIRRLIWSPQK